MKKKILFFGLGAVAGAVAMYLLKEKELEEIRKTFDEEDDFEYDEYEDDFFDEDLDEEESGEVEECVSESKGSTKTDSID